MEQDAGGELGGQNMIIILNPNGTINEELMLAHGVNQEAIRAVTEAHGGTAAQGAGVDPTDPLKTLRHPIPQVGFRFNMHYVKDLMAQTILKSASVRPLSIVANI